MLQRCPIHQARLHLTGAPLAWQDLGEIRLAAGLAAQPDILGRDQNSPTGIYSRYEQVSRSKGRSLGTQAASARLRDVRLL